MSDVNRDPTEFANDVDLDSLLPVLNELEHLSGAEALRSLHQKIDDLQLWGTALHALWHMDRTGLSGRLSEKPSGQAFDQSPFRTGFMRLLFECGACMKAANREIKKLSESRPDLDVEYLAFATAISKWQRDSFRLAYAHTIDRVTVDDKRAWSACAYDLMDRVALLADVLAGEAEAADRLAGRKGDGDKKQLREQVNALTDRQRYIVQVLFEHKAFDREDRMRIQDIAAAAEGRHANPENFKEPMSQLVLRRIADSKRGRGGGVWLTSEGQALAKYLQRRKG